MASSHIRILDQSTAMKIAAGEVIERPSSAVRELIDNALDAHADWIKIIIERGGCEFLSVQDNGIGMCEEDISLCYFNHATSKINHFDDLNNLKTFGFRGEALASLAEISTLNISSCTKDMDFGINLQIKFGEKISQTSKGMDQGTNITITDFFQNVPARLKFLGTDTGEYRSIIQEFLKKVLARPDVGFELIHNNEQKYLLNQAHDLQHRICELFPELQKVLHPFIHEEDGIKIYGFLSEPSWYKPNRTYQYLFVNGRAIEWTVFRQQISLAYNNLLPPSKFAAVFCYAEIDPQKIDFNVHPQKREIRFYDDKIVADIVRHALKMGIAQIAPQQIYPTSYATPSINFPPKLASHFTPPTNSVNSINNTKSLSFEKIPQQEHLQELFQQSSHTDSMAEILLKANYIGEVFTKYLIFEYQNDLYLVDFHAMHERIRYENILIKKDQELESQMIIPTLFELAKHEADIFEEIKTSLQRLGFYLTRISDTSFSVEAIPIFLEIDKLDTVLRDLFVEKSRLTLQDSYIWDSICKMIACKGSVRGGDQLNSSEIQQLLHDWALHKAPASCPHGRPIVIQIDSYELDKRFKRTGF